MIQTEWVVERLKEINPDLRFEIGKGLARVVVTDQGY